MFGVYLLHDTTSIGRKLYQIPEAWLAANTDLHPMIVVFLCACLTFCICLGVDFLRRAMVELFVFVCRLVNCDSLSRMAGRKLVKWAR